MAAYPLSLKSIGRSGKL